jgi:hypothetical protein
MNNNNNNKRVIMGKEIKEKIEEFLKSNADKKFTVREISKRLKFGYPATLKWVSVLEAEKIIKVNDYGNRKDVYFNKEARIWKKA